MPKGSYILVPLIVGRAAHKSLAADGHALAIEVHRPYYSDLISCYESAAAMTIRHCGSALHLSQLRSGRTRLAKGKERATQ